MRLQIVQIADRGVPNRERLHLRALSDVNLNFFVVFDTTYTSPSAISNLQRHAYWFPSHLVKAGDHVILSTGNGTQSSSWNPAGGTNHFFYWGLQHTIWNQTGDCAVLFELSSWQTSAYE